MGNSEKYKGIYLQNGAFSIVFDMLTAIIFKLRISQIRGQYFVITRNFLLLFCKLYVIQFIILYVLIEVNTTKKNLMEEYLWRPLFMIT
jgi:hypothetical protein